MRPNHPLKTYRLSHEPRLSQQQLADRFAVTRTTVARWETGTRKIDPDLLPKISTETGISRAVLRPDLVELLQGAAE